MKVYISQPMKGLTTEEIIRQRRELTAEICIIENVNRVDVVNKLDANFDKGPVYNLGRSIMRMYDAEMVYFLPGWENYNGCRIERSVAEYYGVPFCDVEAAGEGYILPGGQTHM